MWGVRVSVSMTGMFTRSMVSRPFRRKPRKGWGTGRMRVRSLLVRLMRMSVLLVGMSRFGCLLVWSDDIHFGSREAAAAHLAHLQPRAHIQRGGGFL